MPFRLCIYLTKIGLPLAVLMIGCTLFIPTDSPISFLRPVLFWCGCVFLAGMLLWVAALLMTGGLRLRCPFCGAIAPAGELKRGIVRLDCEHCGHVRNGGWFGLKLIRNDGDE